MRFYRARSWTDALKMKADFGREGVPLNGGTDLMVEINFDRRRPEALIDLASLEELRTWREDDGEVYIGAGTTMARIVAEFRERIPGLAMAARTVGSPQIRNRATLGGNVATASRPATPCLRSSCSTPWSRSNLFAVPGPCGWPTFSSAPRRTPSRLTS